MDADMMDAEFLPAAPSQVPPVSEQNDAVRDLLTLARQLIDQGNPSQALHAVIFLINWLYSLYLFFIFNFIYKLILSENFVMVNAVLF